MKNKNLQFKTNLNCGGCVSKVQSDLDNANGVCEWNVDVANNDKILTVKSEGITEDEIVAIIKSKGFKAEPISASSQF
ncbi:MULTISPECIES: heavy-metal-associated domain-containing protein [Olivibacter]|jgi:copper chaperone CopZ|uniref:Heavy-metal-associated domain-containing protein n=2 Tax=Olivibacter TaxID=376469 RepID=A0ABV6HQK9_9SPHI|nr:MULTISPECIES: heavy-metal-associated domain-containing protein [Olivibacter]MDX3917434.1 heavy-metal-associated domain-containing protein [Pseudosphingobacterium sp.]QEL03938.1 heavy-metal-associated domain-containing protein [Olivibacter sp. LS-1]